MLETETTFGAWLRHQRRQTDLTQTELASRIGYSVVTIRKLERDELRAAKQLAERLAQWLLITHLRAELAATLPPDRFAAAWAQGTHLDLMATAADVVAELATVNGSDVHESM